MTTRAQVAEHISRMFRMSDKTWGSGGGLGPDEWRTIYEALSAPSPPRQGVEREKRVATDEMVTAAMREFEKWTSLLRYKEAEGWHVNDRLGMRYALNASLALLQPEGDENKESKA